MTTDNIIAIAAIASTLSSIIGVGAITFAFKNHGRTTILETNSDTHSDKIKKLEEHESRITTLEANANNHAEMIRNHKEESKDFRRALEQNTLAINELTTLIKHKL